MLVTLNHVDLYKNKIREAEVQQVLASATTVECDLSPSRQGNNRAMLIGFTLSSRLLELGIEFLPDALYIFHAADATRHYREEFARRMKT